ncbi:AAEL014482-PA [Aedes aegypti]|uniref:AAEL014482-PA n=1 Tax=Aedes aegypti TaxID=7159 RepID=Q16G92_AEDAE|nr:AAEL014482-PA [Aedes aegypti]
MQSKYHPSELQWWQWEPFKPEVISRKPIPERDRFCGIFSILTRSTTRSGPCSVDFFSNSSQWITEAVSSNDR